MFTLSQTYTYYVTFNLLRRTNSHGNLSQKKRKKNSHGNGTSVENPWQII